MSAIAAEAPRPQASRFALGVATTCAWMVVSSLLIMLNKYVFTVGGFPFPLATTGLGQATSAVGGYMLHAAAGLPLRPWPPPRTMATLMPIILCTTATMAFGNVAYLHLSVSFIQILKAFTPALTMVLAVSVGLETISAPLVLALLLIGTGTGLAVIVESGTPSFQLLGFLIFAASSASEAARVVGSQLLLGRERFNQAEVLVYVSTPSAVLLLLGSAVLELPKMRERGVVPPVLLLAFSSTVSCLVNLASYAAIGSTSSLTFKVSGCVKNLAVVWFSTLAYAEHVAIAQIGGYIVSMAGFVMYSRVKGRAAAAAAAKRPRRPTLTGTPEGGKEASS